MWFRKIESLHSRPRRRTKNLSSRKGRRITWLPPTILDKSAEFTAPDIVIFMPPPSSVVSKNNIPINNALDADITDLILRQVMRRPKDSESSRILNKPQ
jgi:hypothetical protein